VNILILAYKYGIVSFQSCPTYSFMLLIYDICDSGEMVKEKVNSGFMSGWMYIAYGLSNKLPWCLTLNYQKNMFC